MLVHEPRRHGLGDLAVICNGRGQRAKGEKRSGDLIEVFLFGASNCGKRRDGDYVVLVHVSDAVPRCSGRYT